ncbi:MAG: DUF2785 domain-containing protein [Planctomycetota bacterium]
MKARLSVVFLLGASTWIRAQEPAGAQEPARDWAAIAAAGHAVPDGADPFALLVELGELLGSPDPRLRDELAYGIAAQWIVRQRLLQPEQLRQLARRWRPNLAHGLGETGTDTVLLRSFSCLALSLIAARDVQQECLSQEELRALLAAAIAFLAGERDLRDHDPQLGWIHATAHTADLLKFLARNPRVDADGLTAILGAIGEKLAMPMAGAFRMGEDERLARAIAAVLLRESCPPAALNAMLATLEAAVQRARTTEPFDPRQFAVEQNVLHCCRTLYALLDLAGELPPHAERARRSLGDWLVALG